MNNKCAFLVNSCDKYEEAWEAFFTLLNKYWSDCPYKIFLNSEDISYPDDKISTIHSYGNWGERLKKALLEIDYEYIIFSLEDFFLQDYVDTDEIEKCIQYMEEDSSIGCIYFKNTSAYNDGERRFCKKYVRMQPRPEYDLYIFNCQIGLWRKEVLLKSLDLINTPWQFEVEGAKLNKKILSQYTFFCSYYYKIDKLSSNEVFPYIVERKTGYGIFDSKWLWNNKKILKRNGINISYNKLGKMGFFEYKYKYIIAPSVAKIVKRIKAKID